MWNGVDDMDGMGNMGGDLGIYRWVVDMDVCGGYGQG